jgi:hypothetical protein
MEGGPDDRGQLVRGQVGVGGGELVEGVEHRLEHLGLGGDGRSAGRGGVAGELIGEDQVELVAVGQRPVAVGEDADERPVGRRVVGEGGDPPRRWPTPTARSWRWAR